MRNNVTKKHYFNYQNYYQNSNLKIKHKTSTKYLYITLIQKVCTNSLSINNTKILNFKWNTKKSTQNLLQGLQCWEKIKTIQNCVSINHFKGKTKMLTSTSCWLPCWNTSQLQVQPKMPEFWMGHLIPIRKSIFCVSRIQNFAWYIYIYSLSVLIKNITIITIMQ